MSCFRTLCETSQISYRMIRRQERSCTRLLLFPASINERHQDSSACLHTASACCQNRSAPINCVRRLQRYVAPQVPPHEVFKPPHSALGAGQALRTAVAKRNVNLGLAQQRPQMPQKVRNESALEVVKVGGFAVAVTDSDIGHRNTRFSGSFEHAKANRVGKHSVGRAPLGKNKCTSLGPQRVENARNDALARLRAFALHPNSADSLGGPTDERKPLKFSCRDDRGGTAVVAQKDIEVRGVIAH